MSTAKLEDLLAAVVEEYRGLLDNLIRKPETPALDALDIADGTRVRCMSRGGSVVAPCEASKPAQCDWCCSGDEEASQSGDLDGDYDWYAQVMDIDLPGHCFRR